MNPSPTSMPVIPAERADDLCNLHMTENCDPALFIAGNQSMVMHEPIAAFQEHPPHVRNIFYETLPPRQEPNQTSFCPEPSERLIENSDLFSLRTTHFRRNESIY